jgi:hypothetical protein
MANNQNKNKREEESWIPVIIMLVIFWPVGLIMLARRFQRLTSEESSDRRTHKLSSGGWVMLAVAAFMILRGAAGMIPAGFLALGGLAMVGYSAYSKKMRHRFDKYLAVIGKRNVMRVSDIAAAIPVSQEQACRDIEIMIAEGRFPQGAYLDMSTKALVIDPTAVEPPRKARRQAEPVAARPEAAAPKPVDMPDPYSRKLIEIRRMDDEIQDEEVSKKVRRIEEVTASIFELVRQNPGKLGQISTFMNYYLPTTLKLLRAYSQLERQTVAGENIRTSKARIEKMLSQLVFAFEQQLDQMFEADARDISSDITVLERMMAKDGLSENPYTLPRSLQGRRPSPAAAAQAVQAAQEDEP